ncbi:MAG: DUF1844 domain-containing protein [Candidatus Margulisbacteria bacterium]|nr:DUF1844 domain-containing protein [Candidatus Margulisiibacteriota bacterium]
MDVDDSIEREKTLFESLVYTLNMTAMQQLGKAGDLLQKKKVDFQGAIDSLDLLKALKSKTLGNLSDEESRFLDKIIENVSKYLAEISSQQDIGFSEVEVEEA